MQKGFDLVKFNPGSLAFLVFPLREAIGFLGSFHGGGTGEVSGLGGNGTIIGLLYLLEQSFLGGIEHKRLVLHLQTGTLYLVTRFHTVENRNGQRKTERFVHVVGELAAERGAVEIRHGVVARGNPGGKFQLRVQGTLGNTDTPFGSRHAMLGGTHDRFRHDGNIVNILWRGEQLERGLHVGSDNSEQLRRRQFQYLAKIEQGEFTIVLRLNGSHPILCQAGFRFIEHRRGSFAHLVQAFHPVVLRLAHF